MSKSKSVQEILLIKEKIDELTKNMQRLELEKIKSELKLSNPVNNWTLLKPGDVIAYLAKNTLGGHDIGFYTLARVELSRVYYSQSDSDASDSDDRHCTPDEEILGDDEIEELTKAGFPETYEYYYELFLDCKEIKYHIAGYHTIMGSNQMNRVSHINDVLDRTKYQMQVRSSVPEIYMLSQEQVSRLLK